MVRKKDEGLLPDGAPFGVIDIMDLVKDDPVVIADGPFKDLEGKVGEIDEDRGKVKVMVSMFGRETPVELDFLQVKKV